MKSSAVSVSSFPELGRWDSAPSRPSGVPVLKKKDPARAGVASDTPAINVMAIRAIVLIDHSPFGLLVDLTSLRLVARHSFLDEAPFIRSRAHRGAVEPEHVADVHDRYARRGTPDAPRWSTADRGVFRVLATRRPYGR